ncbi:MAG: glycosyl transferase group 1 [Chitinophagaceae bacterium]|nr:glycosyl transferase group 1 [Chitinophagaceae bacterium]
MRKILFIAAHRPDRSPSQRFRFEQYFNFLATNNYTCDFSYLIDEKSDKIFYSKGNYFGKFIIFVKSFFKRLRDVYKASSYDIIFIQREAFMTGSVFFEKQFSKSKAKVVFDFDDSIWKQQETEATANKALLWLKRPSKTGDIIGLSDLIIAGNEYLATYARKYNSHVAIIPTTIDTEEYKPRNDKKSDTRICIGWSGSITTIEHFCFAIPALEKLKEKYQDKIYFKVLGDDNYKNDQLGIQGIGWSKKDEISELQSFDIGIMPLPDDEWTKGKCGLKGLLYMALGIPTIMSPVGVNKDIIKDGENGYLASDVEEWVTKISSLIDSETLRQQMGEKGRQVVEDKYSVHANRSLYLRLFNELIA